MPEWLLIVLVIAGIFLLGVFFAILGFFKNLARLLFLGLFVFLLILLTNRIFPAIESSRFPDGTLSPDGEFRLPRVDPDSEFSESLRDVGRSIDDFIFGSGSTEPGTARSRDFVYPIPEPPSAPSAIAEQPAQPSQPVSQPTQITEPSRATQVTDQQPLPALW
jgi:hypothetical protein